MTKDEWYKQLFEHLEASRFRSSFHLKQKNIDYINVKGLDVIRQHAQDFIAKREAPAFIPNMESRRRLKDIRYLLHNMQPEPVVGSASESGIRCSRAGN